MRRNIRKVKNMVKFRKTTISILSIGLAACFSTSIATMAIADSKKGAGVASGANASAISRLDAPIDHHIEDYFDSNVVHRLSDSIASNQEISVILSLNTKSTLDAYLESDKKLLQRASQWRLYDRDIHFRGGFLAVAGDSCA